MNQTRGTFILFAAAFLLVLCSSKANAHLFLAGLSVSCESRIAANTLPDVNIASQARPVRLSLVQHEQPDRISKSRTFSHTLISENTMDHRAVEAIANPHLLALGPKEACGTDETDPSENNIVEVSGVTLTRIPEPAKMFLLGFGLIVLGHMARTAARKRLTSGKQHAYLGSLLKVISPGNHQSR